MKLFGNIRILSTIAGIALAVSACDNNGYQIPRSPQFPDLYHPTQVTLLFPPKSGIDPLKMSIDNINMQIFNNAYLPYKTKTDSAYLLMALSSETEVLIKNITTGKVTRWTSLDTGKIDISGGRLLIDVTRNEGKKSQTLQYKLRVQMYGYNPNKFQWDKQKTMAPIAADVSKAFSVRDKNYWMARQGDQVYLYEIKNIQQGDFEMIAATMPKALKPTSLTIDHMGGAWCLDDNSHIYHSSDLITWEMIPTDNVEVSAIAYDLMSRNDEPVKMSLIGKNMSDDKAYTYELANNELKQISAVDKNFPIDNVFFFPYEVAGNLSAYAIGGLQADGSAVNNSFFTSNGVDWAPLPTNFSNKSFRLPLSGALYLRDGKTVYLVGGKYNEGISANMYISNDRGLNWTPLDKEKRPGEDFRPRTGTAGIVIEENGDKTIYLIGGRIDGEPSQEIWKGFNDKTGGIINQVF